MLSKSLVLDVIKIFGVAGNQSEVVNQGCSCNNRVVELYLMLFAFVGSLIFNRLLGFNTACISPGFCRSLMKKPKQKGIPMDTSKLLITAATGNVGTPLVKALQRKNIGFTAGTRDAGKARQKLGNNLPTVYFDYDDPQSFAPALKGKEIMFLCGPSATPHAVDLIMPLIDEAKKQGIRHIVFIASYPDVMEKIKAKGFDYTFVKANFFMQNFEIYQTRDIRERGEIFLPCGDGKAPFIHTRDIGEVCAEVLTQPEKYRSETLYITGPQAMDHFDAAAVFSDVLGKHITYRNPDDATYRQEMKQRGFSDTYIEAMIAVFGKIKKGLVSQTSPVVEQMLSRKPLSLKDYVQERREIFGG